MPLGFKMINEYGLVSNATLSLVKSVNERVHQQLWSFGWNDMPPREDDAAWISLELQVYRQVLADNKVLLDGWLRWGMLAYIFQCYSYAYRKTIGHKILERLNEIILPPEETNRIRTKELLKEFREDQKGRYRRNCAIWVLMCLATASARRFKDDGGTSAGLEGPTDKASMMLMARVRTLLDLDATKPRNANLEWEIVEAVVLQFWCPPWILKDWETMWKEHSGTIDVQAAAYFRVWHHWASAILPEDASTV